MTADPRQGFGATAADFARVSLSLIPLLVLVRIYEIVIARGSHVLPDGRPGLVARE